MRFHPCQPHSGGHVAEYFDCQRMKNIAFCAALRLCRAGSRDVHLRVVTPFEPLPLLARNVDVARLVGENNRDALSILCESQVRLCFVLQLTAKVPARFPVLIVARIFMEHRENDGIKTNGELMQLIARQRDGPAAIQYEFDCETDAAKLVLPGSPLSYTVRDSLQSYLNPKL